MEDMSPRFVAVLKGISKISGWPGARFVADIIYIDCQPDGDQSLCLSVKGSLD